MKIALSTDEHTHLIETIKRELSDRGHEVMYFGPEAGEKSVDWPDVTLKAIEAVKAGRADEAIILCWTGTGCTIAANKVPGIRAALCNDGETARGARTWNHANVLALSLRSTPEGYIREILDSWFSTPFSEDKWNLDQMQKLANLDKRHSGDG